MTNIESEKSAITKAASARHRQFDFGALGDLIAILATLIVVKQTLLPVSLLYAGPASTFIINRASSFLQGGLRADLIAAVFSAIFFGYRHYYYQGMNGALTTGAAGLALALLYLWFGRRNILPLAFAHGIVNSIGMTPR